MAKRNRRDSGATTSNNTRAAVYVRVSTDEQVEGYSLDAQVRACRAFCEQQDWDPVLYRDEGTSARTDDLSKRPDFARMLADAEAGRLDAVVVHKLDRFARNRRVAFDALERLDKAGVRFVTVAEGTDEPGPNGELIRTIKVGLSQYYSDNLSFETKKGKAERKRQGMYNGLLPFGVTKGPDGVPVLDTVPRPHPAGGGAVVPAEGLRTAFELAAEGKTDREVARALTAAGYRTSGNRGANPFSKDTVRAILRNRFYLGELPDGEGGWVPGKHGSLVDPDLFGAAERARGRNLKRPRRTETEARSPWALSGLATCAGCRRAMTAYGRSGGKQRVQCAGRTQGLGCDAPTFYAHEVDKQVGEFLARSFAIPERERERLLDAWASRRQPDRKDAQAERKRLEAKLERLNEVFVEGDLDRARYRRQKADLKAQIAALPGDERLPAEAGRRLADYLADVALAWRDAGPADRNRLAREMLDEVVVDNKTAVAGKPRPDLLPFFEAVGCQPDPEMTYGRKRRDSVERLHSAGRSDAPLPAGSGAALPPGWQCGCAPAAVGQALV